MIKLSDIREAKSFVGTSKFKDVPVGHVFSANQWGSGKTYKFVKRDERSATDLAHYKKHGHAGGWEGRTQFGMRDKVIHHGPADTNEDFRGTSAVHHDHSGNRYEHSYSGGLHSIIQTHEHGEHLAKPHILHAGSKETAERHWREVVRESINEAASPEYLKWKGEMTAKHGALKFKTKPHHVPGSESGWNYTSFAHKDGQSEPVGSFMHSHVKAVLAGKHGEEAKQKMETWMKTKTEEVVNENWSDIPSYAHAGLAHEFVSRMHKHLRDHGRHMNQDEQNATRKDIGDKYRAKHPQKVAEGSSNPDADDYDPEQANKEFHEKLKKMVYDRAKDGKQTNEGTFVSNAGEFGHGHRSDQEVFEVKKSTDPNDYHSHHVFHNGEHAGSLRQHTFYRDKKKPGARLVSSRTEKTGWAFKLNPGHAKPGSEKLGYRQTNEFSSMKNALQALADHHKSNTPKVQEGLGGGTVPNSTITQNPTKKTKPFKEFRKPALTTEANGIKGWKNAHGDIAKLRHAQHNAAQPVRLVSLKKNGEESKLHDATHYFGSEADALKHHDNMKQLNPGRRIAHRLYVNGEAKGDLVHEEVNEDKLSKPKGGGRTLTGQKAHKINVKPVRKLAKSMKSYYNSGF